MTGTAPSPACRSFSPVWPATACGWTAAIAAFRSGRGACSGRGRCCGIRLSYGWSEQGFSFRNAYSSGLNPWADLYRWRAARNNFLFFMDDQMLFFLPRAALSNAQAEDLVATAAASGAPAAAA